MIDNTQVKHLELTQGQLSLWTGQKLNPDTSLRNVVYTFEIHGELNTNVFKKSFQYVVNSVEALRTVFVEKNDGSPIQSVLNQMKYDLDVVDLPANIKAEEIDTWLVDHGKNRLDISECIFQTFLVRINIDKYIWFLNIHHLVIDVVSIKIIYDLIQRYYVQIEEFDECQINELPSIGDYLVYEKEQGSNPKNDNSKVYWTKKAKSINSLSQLYGVSNKFSGTSSTRVSLKLGSERSKKLKELAKVPEIRSWTHHLTLFNIFSTLLFVYLYRVSGQRKLAIGTTNHNRTTKQFQETVAYLVQIFPIATEILEEDTFISLLQRVKLETNELLRHAGPGLLTPEISRSFNVVLNYINTNFTDFAGIPTKTQWVPNGHIDAAHHLQCHIIDFNATGEIELLFDLNHAVFDTNLIERAPGHFLNILDALLQNGNQPLSETCMVSNTEKQNFTVKPKNNTPVFESIAKQIENQVSLNHDEIALRCKKEVHTYGEINELSNRLATFLISKGVKKGEKVALYLDRSPEYVIAILAVLKCGGTFIPIASDQPAQRIAFILSDSDSALVLTKTELQPNIPASVASINLDSDLELDKNEIDQSTPITSNESDIAYIIYTSGSTGKPKGVLISHKAISNYLNWAKLTYATHEKFVSPLFTSIGFDLTITSTFLPLITGGELILYKESNQGPDVSLMDVLADNEVNSIKLTPSHLTLLQGMDLSHSKLRTMIVGGEDFKTHLAAATQSAFEKQLKIYNEYGPTEATVGCVVCQFDESKHIGASVPIGVPIENMQAYILDSYANPVPKGVIGELYLSGVGLADGYANLADLTKEKFTKNPFHQDEKMYRTGDLARINKLGLFEYLGRTDEQVKFRGFRIELSDIESNMLKHPAIQNAAVVLMENDNDEKRIIDETGYQEQSENELQERYLLACYTGKQKLSSKELLVFLRKELPQYMVPNHFKFIKEFPLTSNGKVDKSVLKALNTEQVEIDTDFVAPDGELEELLAAIWKEVLRLKQVGVHDDFIALGGHSLAAIRITTRINEEIEMKFPLNKIFELPTIAQYAKYIEETLTALMEEEK